MEISKLIEYQVNLLNSTWIHPESYKAAETYLKRLGCSVEDIGTTKLRDKSRNKDVIKDLSSKYDLDALKLIKRAFEMDEEDIRVDNNYDFHRGDEDKSKLELKVGLVTTGTGWVFISFLILKVQSQYPCLKSPI